MAWRPTRYLLEGELDNTKRGRVTGWMKFAGINGKVTFDLKGDFHRDIRGTKIHFQGEGIEEDPEAASYMHGFSQHQTGSVGDITGGLPPQDYVECPYIEWYSPENGRVVIELEPDQVKVLGNLLPWMQKEPIRRDQQARKMAKFLGEVAEALDVPPEHALCLSRTPGNERDQRDSE